MQNSFRPRPEAAINILIKALREIADTVGQTEFQAWGERTSFDDGQLTVPK